MSDAERIWSEKSDEELLEAAAALEEFTEQGQWIIRAELRRRGFDDPAQQANEWPSSAKGLECLRCQAPISYVDPEADTPFKGALTGSRVPIYTPGGPFRLYVCRKCGHVELFMDLPEEN